jgi:DNA topoisomerase-1
MGSVPPPLRYGSDHEPGYRRLGRTRFRYVDGDGRVVDAEHVVRIRALAIPPAWTDVWIAPAADWHLQATGRDARGRKQYRYHDGYREERESAKFGDLHQFGLDLTGLRRAVARDLADSELSHDRVVAAIVRLLDVTSLRVGNEEYARTNGSFGLTTLRVRHARAGTRTVRLQFRGKSAHDFDVTIADPKVAKVVRGCQHLPGQLLFQYDAGGGDAHPVTSTDVNTYLQRHACSTATAKTFRTWGASVMGAALLAEADPPASVRERSRSINTAVREVAEHLGNTLAVCKRSYVHPVVYAALDVGELAKRWEGAAPLRPGGLAADERRFWNLLDDHGG